MKQDAVKKDINKVASNMKEKINWQRYVNLVYRIGPQLNSKPDRFKKSEAMEQAICCFCVEKDLAKYLGGDEKGKDIIFDETFIEVKYCTGCIQTKSNNLKKTIGKNVRLTNGMGKGSEFLSDNYAPFVLLLDKTSAALISKTQLQGRLKNTGDCLVIEKPIPADETTIVLHPKKYSPTIKESGSNNELKTELNEVLLNFIKSTPE